jgi:hypothetical protein
MNHEDEIRLIAHQIWVEEGYPDGCHLEHWVRAESIFIERQGQVPSSASSKPKARKSSAKKKRSRSQSQRSN